VKRAQDPDAISEAEVERLRSTRDRSEEALAAVVEEAAVTAKWGAHESLALDLPRRPLRRTDRCSLVGELAAADGNPRPASVLEYPEDEAVDLAGGVPGARAARRSILVRCDGASGEQPLRIPMSDVEMYVDYRPPPPPPLRTNRTRRVLHPVLIGHAPGTWTISCPKASRRAVPSS